MANHRRDRSRSQALIVVVVVLIATACSSAETAAPPETTSTSPTVPQETTTPPSTTVDEPTPSSLPEAALPLRKTNQFDLLSPGSYTSDMIALELEFTTTAEFNASTVLPGTIIMESPSSTNAAFAAVGFFAADTLLDSDVEGRQRSRMPLTMDLSEFLGSRDGVKVVDSRDDELGGLAARVWRIEYTEPCAACTFELLFNQAGWISMWGTLPGVVQELWTIDAPGAPIVVSVEAPTDTFDQWSAEVQRHLFDQLSFGEPTGFSLSQPEGEFAAGFGEYAIGRAELDVVDTSRPTTEITQGLTVVVPEADERILLLSVAYPSVDGGFGGAPASGSFPLVIVAPALNDGGLVLPADRQLASHGFVVVAVRFPESSYPGGSAGGVPQQPADISFMVDEIQRSALPADIAAVTDLDHIGVIGHSGGATTAFGLLAFECCQDDRFAAVVAHAGVPFDFDSVQVPSTAPILHIGSQADQVSPIDTLREFHGSIDGPSSLVELEFTNHLDWLRPSQASRYDETFELVLAFLDQHLRDGRLDFASMAASDPFVAFDER